MLGQVSPAPFMMQAHKTGQNSTVCVLARLTEMRSQSHSTAPKISGLCGQGAAAEGTVTTCQIVGWLDVRLWEAVGFGSAMSPPVKPVSLCTCGGVKVAICRKRPTQTFTRVLWPGSVLVRKWAPPEHPCFPSWSAVHHRVRVLLLGRRGASSHPSSCLGTSLLGKHAVAPPKLWKLLLAKL